MLSPRRLRYLLHGVSRSLSTLFTSITVSPYISHSAIEKERGWSRTEKWTTGPWTMEQGFSVGELLNGPGRFGYIVKCTHIKRSPRW